MADPSLVSVGLAVPGRRAVRLFGVHMSRVVTYGPTGPICDVCVRSTLQG